MPDRNISTVLGTLVFAHAGTYRHFEMKERDGYTVAEISEQTGVTKRNVYYYLDRARAIGQQYNRD